MPHEFLLPCRENRRVKMFAVAEYHAVVCAAFILFVLILLFLVIAAKWHKFERTLFSDQSD